MPKAQQTHAKSRQRPVSCHFCRMRKLRCSRTAPCSNCVARGVACDLEHALPQPSSAPSVSENPEIVDRLQRLENLLLAQKVGEQGQVSQTPELAEAQQLVHSWASSTQNQTLDVDRDFTWLESANVGQLPSRSKTTSSQVVFNTCAVGQVTRAQSCRDPHNSNSVTTTEPSTIIWLPSHAEARILLETFNHIAHNLPRVVHIPTLPSILEQVYTALNQQSQMHLGRVILLLSIFAAAAHSCQQINCGQYGLFRTPAEGSVQASAWIKAAERVLEMACRSSPVSIEGVQGAVIIAFIAAHVDGPQKYRLLFGMSIVLARNLGLHRIDHPSNAAMMNTAGAEMGRRLWWYLCASDWTMAARTRGMEEGIYSCHPRQMATKKPLNINDEELFDGMSRIERPLSQPTIMSYTILLIRLAEISRNTIGRCPLAMAHTGGLSHDAVMDIDTDLQSLINDIPPFYSMSEATLMDSHKLTRTQSKAFVLEGRFIYLQLYLHRCKLHLPYFARSSDDPASYASREICIKHARLIIQSELWQETLDTDTATTFKFTDLLIGVFLACIVLLMDVCANPSSPQYQKQREEIQKSFKIIEEAKKESETTGKFVESLVRILRKYSISLQKRTPNKSQQPASSEGDGVGISKPRPQGIHGRDAAFDIITAPGNSGSDETAFTSASNDQFGASDGHELLMSAEVPPDGNADDLASYWNDFTQGFERGIDVNSFDWDNIFLELDSSFM